MNDPYVYNKWFAIQDIQYKYFMKNSQLKTSIKRKKFDINFCNNIYYSILW